MKDNLKKIIAAVVALTMTATLSGCAAAAGDTETDDGYEISGAENGEQGALPEQNGEQNEEQGVEQPEEQGGESTEKPEVPEVPKTNKAYYIMATADGVNLRSGAGTAYSVRGSTQKSTLYALNGKTGKWYKTGFKNSAAYISESYCESVAMTASEDERIEAIIAEGTKLLGTAYVFGATRYHDGSGRLLKNFTTNAFDCSSLMQYIFYKGAHVNLQVNTRTQIYQGKTVKKSQLKRGDLMFFTNDSRRYNTGIERVGHVALYLGDNWILHTASDFAKIEQISAKRWSYFIQGQRIF